MEMLPRYAQLLVQYSLDIQPGDKLLIRTTTLAEPLVREVYRLALRAGAAVDIEWEFEAMSSIFAQEATNTALQHVSPTYQRAMETYQAYLYILAPFSVQHEHSLSGEKAALRQQILQAAQTNYTRRTADRSLKRTLCLYPTDASAQEAGMPTEEYARFVFKACRLYDDNPTESWLQVRQSQQHIVDMLNQRTHIRYQGPGTDLSFSTQGRTWINSDGQTNMPSGEVYTSPVENSVNGVVHFSLPAIYQGTELENVTLYVKDGFIEKWEATRGKSLLDTIFAEVAGSRYFGEAAIGTNYHIQQQTKNILFDEKMGGTIHLAIGQSYLQAGGQNHSAIHWDFITDMTREGRIYADHQLIYENGQFLNV